MSQKDRTEPKEQCSELHPSGHWRCALPPGHNGTHSDRRGREWGSTTARGNAPIDDPVVQAIATALQTAHDVNFGTVYINNPLRAEVMAMHVVEQLRARGFNLYRIGGA